MRDEEIKGLTDDRVWAGGWYQPIEFPDGSRTFSTKYQNFFGRGDFGEKKWRRMIDPRLFGTGTFVEIGCNAGLFLVLAERRFAKVIGLENFPYFLRQCKRVLREFGSAAEVIEVHALDFDIPSVGPVDTLLMSNVLYWLMYGNGGGKYPAFEERLDEFMREISRAARRTIFIGAEGVNRIGGSLDVTLPFVRRFFSNTHGEIVATGHRTMNVIVADGVADA